MMGTQDSEGQEVVPLFEEKLCLMAAADHPLAQQKKIRLADLDKMDFSYTYEDCCFTDEFRRRMNQGGIHPSSELFLGSIHAVINTAKEDRRLCLIPYVCVEKVKAMGLIELDWIEPFNIYDVILIQKGVYRSKGINRLIQQAREYSAQLKEQEATQEILLL